jgi:mono/diheme cytochrome c family protein
MRRMVSSHQAVAEQVRHASHFALFAFHPISTPNLFTEISMMVRNFIWARYVRPLSVAAVFLFLLLNLFTPASTLEQASPTDRAELSRMLNDACGQCHNLNRVILETGDWKLKDWMHAFDTMAKSPGLTKTEKKAIANYVDTHREAIELEQGDKHDKPDTMGTDTYYVLFENRCVVCHDAEVIDRIPDNLEREELKRIVDRMVEKAPHFLDGVNEESIVECLESFNTAQQEIAEIRYDT